MSRMHTSVGQVGVAAFHLGFLSAFLCLSTQLHLHRARLLQKLTSKDESFYIYPFQKCIELFLGFWKRINAKM